jgi:hypothetical protein
MATTVTFNDLTHTATEIKAPMYPEEPGRSYPSIVGRTQGGGLKTADLGGGSAYENPVLHFRDVSNTHYTNFKTFVESHIAWSARSFTYTDPNAVAHTNMHYLSGLEDARSKKGERWDFNIRLAKDMSA